MAWRSWFWSRVLPVALAGAWLAACGGGGAGSGSEGGVATWRVSDAAVADIDGDGRNEVLGVAAFSPVQGADTGELRVFRSGAAQPDRYSFGDFPWRMTLGDVDGDGAIDVLVTDVDARAIWYLRQDPNDRGRFLAARMLASGIHSMQVALVDATGDDVPDIVATDQDASARGLRVYAQDPMRRGEFAAPVDLALPARATAIVAGDVDGDTRPDLLVYLQSVGGVASSYAFGVLMQTAPGRFAPLETMAPQTGVDARRLLLGDYDRDGRTDVLAYLSPSRFASDRSKVVTIRQGPGGLFGPPVDTLLADIEQGDDAHFADLNDDGALDMAIGGIGLRDGELRARVHLYQQDGAGAFTRIAQVAPQFGVGILAAGDFDGDLRVDLAMLGDEHHCKMYLQSTTVPGAFDRASFLPD